MHRLLDETRQCLAATLAGCTAEQVDRHPGGAAQRWSARQVVEHLCITWTTTAVGIEDRLRKGRPLRTRPTLAQHFRQLAVCECGLFPRGREAPAAVRPGELPPAGEDGDQLIARLAEALGAMDGALSRIEPQAKHAPVLTHFLLGPMSVRRWRRFHRVHGLHHAKQLRSAIHEDELRQGS